MSNCKKTCGECAWAYLFHTEQSPLGKCGAVKNSTTTTDTLACPAFVPKETSDES